MVTIEYLVPPEDADDFIAAMTRHGIMVESYIIDTILDMLRQRERMPVSDLEVREKARVFHQGNSPPKVNRLFSAIGHRRIFE